MISKPRIYHNPWVLLPFGGVVLFALFYLLAALYYPGGSQVDENAEGFSWMNNYWCNLLTEYGINHRPNHGRPFAFSAMIILCFTLPFFWYYFSIYSGLLKVSRLVIQFSGTFSMVFVFFLFTDLHDTFVEIASVLGIIALIGTLIGLYKLNWKALLIFGIINLIFLLLNDYLYQKDLYLSYLPVVQKISFITFFSWIAAVSFQMYSKPSK